MNSKVFLGLLILVFVFICVILTSSLVSIIFLTSKQTNESLRLVDLLPGPASNNLLVPLKGKINIDARETTNQKDSLFCIKRNISRAIRILNGKEALPNSFPWMASLRLFKEQNLYDHFCAGVLISKKVVLTAAHCVNLRKTDEILVVFGLHYRTDLSNSIMNNTYGVSKIIIHENSGENDIALLVLSKTVNFSQNIYPICLTKENDLKLFYSSVANVIGWGLKSIKQQSLILQQTQLTILDKNDLRCSIHLKESVKDKLFCALHISKIENISTICSGDSGGPLFVYYENKWILLGIVSFVQTYFSSENNEYFCDPSLPSFYT
ncbi:unnamed protein product, partial [Brachionus calyciflorus]